MFKYDESPIYKRMKSIKDLRKTTRELLLKWWCKPRYILERKIFPKIKNKKVLFVGIAHYTINYLKKLEGNDLWTIDVDPEVARFGAKKHITGSIIEIDKYFPDKFFDFIILFGVFGFGLNEATQGEETLKKCYKVLKNGGIIIIGSDNVHSPNLPRLKNYKKFTSIPLFGFPRRYKFVPREKIFLKIKGFFFFEFLRKE